MLETNKKEKLSEMGFKLRSFRFCTSYAQILTNWAMSIIWDKMTFANIWGGEFWGATHGYVGWARC